MPQLADLENCTACTACYNICTHHAIQMIADKEGFLMPVIDNNKCVECHLCEQSCPVLHPDTNTNNEMPKAFAVWSQRDRIYSSSGGAFSAFARMTLAEKGVVFGASFDEHLHCRHIEIQDEKELPALRGSKYVQSEIGDVYKQIRAYLKENRKVLFCGTPCQVAGLKNFLRKPYDNLLTLDLVCHGVPSDAIFQSYLEKLSRRMAVKIENYEFRHRDGWGKAPAVATSCKFRPVYGVDALYMEAFNASAIFRKSCYQCQYAKLPRIGECTLGDFWGIGRHGIPFKHSIQKGVSLVLANNASGETALRRLQNTFIEERTIEEALIENQNIIHPSPIHPERESIISAFLNPSTSLSSIRKQYKLSETGIKNLIKEYAMRWHVFNFVKAVYNKFKSL